MTDTFAAALSSIVADDLAALEAVLTAGPDLAARRVTEERFVGEIVHQLYAGDTLLHVAAAGFRAGAAQVLMAKGADVHARNRRGAQPLHYAADTNHHDGDAQAATIELLLNAGADPDARDKSGTAPLHRAVRTRGSAAVEALLAGGADAMLANGSGSRPLDLAHMTTGRGGTGSPQARQAQAEIVRLLMAAGAARMGF